jgi:hypothetical protein
MCAEQVGHAADLAAAHGVGLTGERERPGPGLADLPGGEMQVDECRIFGGAAARLVQALAIQAQRGRARRAAELLHAGKETRCMEQAFFGDATSLGYRKWRVVEYRGLDLIEAIGVGPNIGRVQPAFPGHDVQHAVEQHHIGSGLYGQIQIGDLDGVGLAWVAKDDLQSRVGLFGIFDAPKKNRMRIGRVGADDEDALGVVDVVIAGGRRVGPQRLLVAGHCAAHAQARVGVDVVGSDQALGELVEDVVVLGQHLARHVKTYRIRPVLTDDLRKTFAREIQRCIPRNGLRLLATVHPAHRLQQAGLTRHGGGGGEVQGRALGAQAAKVGRVIGVAPHPVI